MVESLQWHYQWAFSLFSLLFYVFFVLCFLSLVVYLYRIECGGVPDKARK